MVSLAVLQLPARGEPQQQKTGAVNVHWKETGLLTHRTTLDYAEVRMHAIGAVASHVLRYDNAAVPCKRADRKDQAMTEELKRYRKKPVVITARGPLTEAEDIATLEGTMHADVGDYVITGVKGERYPCKPDIFRATYDPA